ncbi:glycoside hydrolase family 3 protein [Spirillospora sp. CA-294931]|uniref:beta-glucosidase n=1 Tax=Spirillospora sp. CA-294931 TaxID=3240042 RepID=UPI003D8B846B
MSARPRRRAALLTAAALALSCIAVPSAHSRPRPWLDRALDPGDRADALVRAMTLEEKVSLLSSAGRKVEGDQTWQVHLKGITRLGMPDLTMVDGSTGVNGKTQLPTPLALAASWNPRTAAAYGRLLGDETRRDGYGVILAPTLNLARDPRHGRTSEALGEDPYLIGRLAAPETRAIQGNRVIANVKHYAVNNVETWRTRLDVEIDERTYQELYLPHFKAAFTKGRAMSAMCAFVKINGTFACDNDALLNRTLRERWGFKGFVRTDAAAEHRVDSVERGLDAEFPTGVMGEGLLAAVRDGRVRETSVDRAVRNILWAMLASGVYDDPPRRTAIPIDEHAAESGRLAEDTVTLLKNDRRALPLGSPSSIAVIGADANTTATYGGGSTNSKPPKKDTYLDAIKARAGNAQVSWAPGTDQVNSASNAPGLPPTPSAVLTAADGTTRGLTTTYYRGADFTSPLTSRVEPGAYIEQAWFTGQGTGLPPSPRNARSVRWTGALTAPADGEYAFDLSSFDPATVHLDGEVLIDNSGQHDDTPKSATVTLKAGERHDLRIDYRPSGDNPHVDETRRLKFGWRAPSGTVDPNVRAAAELARRSRVAIVVARDFQSEGQDARTTHLPNGQDALIEAVAAANPNTIVVLTTGTAVATPWAGRVRAVVEAWYGGSAAGSALAKVLFGDVDPSGRLPVTFPRRDADLIGEFPGHDQQVTYDEGLKVGYRHYDADGVTPAYPFGHGLSYTRFDYRDLRLSARAFTAAPAGPDGTLDGRPAVTVTATVRNIGDRPGAVVPQVYVASPRSTGEPPKQLKGFTKVWLRPGESRRVSMRLDQQAFAMFDTATDRWRVEPGDYGVLLGASAGDIRLSASVHVPRGR